MEKIFAWFKANYPDYELIFQCDSINGSYIFYIRKLTPGSLMFKFKKIISIADIMNSVSPDDFVMNTLKELIESMEE